MALLCIIKAEKFLVMLLREKSQRSFQMNRQLGSSLAVVAGTVNVLGFLQFGYYCANMTGNASSLALKINALDVRSAFLCFALIASFVLGAIVCTVLVNMGRRKGWGAVYAFSLVLEAAILVTLGIKSAWFAQAGVPDGGATLVLSFVMGLQNATVTRISGSVVRTTHVTGMLTDLGIEISDWLESFYHHVDDEYLDVIKKRLWLHAQIVFCFIVGGILGAVGYMHCKKYILFIVAIILVALAAPGIIENARTSARKT
ncbi:putative transmembrane protein [Acetobacter pomorum]|nr:MULTISPECIES: YoaK family protein [Acetobacter]KGB26748.1 putative transmembrane protein [Acetobacter pomorum]